MDQSLLSQMQCTAHRGLVRNSILERLALLLSSLCREKLGEVQVQQTSRERWEGSETE